MPPETIAELLKMGLPGIAIIALGVVAYKKDAKVDELNEKRIAENREMIKTIEQNTNSIETFAEVLRERKNS